MKKNTTKIHHYGPWCVLCFVLYFFLPGILYPILNEKVFIVQQIPLIAVIVLIILSVRQHYRIKNNKQILNTYETQNNVPYMHNISTYVAIYPMLCLFSLAPAGILANMLSPTVGYIIIILALGLGWLPGLILFIKDQKKLYQYQKNHECRNNFWIRGIEFLVIYFLINFHVLWLAYQIYEFVQHAQ